MSRLVVAIGHVEFTGGSQVLYVVKVQQDADEWEVRRTYSDFRKLRDDVQRVMKDARAHILDDACSRDFARELQELPFPAKRLFGSRKDHVVKERAVELHRFLIKLLFLTHTYRKAQKARYDQYVQALPSHQQAAYAALQDRTQASVSVFYLLRDFLKPVTIKTDVPPHSGDLLGSASDGAFPGANEQRESSPKRLIRESKILAMRSSNASERKQQQQQSSKEAMRENDKMQQHQRREQQVEKMRHEQHKQQQQQRKKSEAADPALDSSVAASSAGNNSSKTVRMNDLMAASERSRAEASSLRQQFLQKQHSASVAEESLRDQFLQKQKSTSALENEHRMQRHYSTPDGHAAIMKNRTARAATSTSALSSVASSSHDESEPEKEKHVASPSVPSSTSSTASGDEVKLVDLSSLAQYKTKKTSPRRDSHSSDRSKSSHKSSTTEKKEKKEKSSTRTKEKKASRIKRKAKSAKNIQMTDSERMSRVSSALNAQAISINAQRELEKYISEYSAIMILRYVDRFINKAVMKAPGCYRVNAQHRLVIDSQRFLQELEDTFTDLPSNFGDLFQTDHDELAFPPALDRYVQLKWDSFQSMGSSNSISHDNGHSSAADQTSDSDDSDTEYEYEEVGGGGYMTAKQTFSNDEESMLQEMIANGTAGREQMLRLRRQINEQGWNRRENPGSRSQRVIEEASSSESDDEEALSRLREKRRSKRREPKRSVSCVVEKYQQEQNARRKDRLQSFGGPIGGFV